MSVITVKPEKDFVYEGNIKSFGKTSVEPHYLNVILCDRENGNKPPVMVEAERTEYEYIEALNATYCAEAYMRKRWHFNEWCQLRKIEVLDASGQVVKTVGADFRPFIGEEGAGEHGQEKAD